MKRIVLLFLLLLLTVSGSQASTIMPTSTQQLTEASQLVVVGVVRSVKTEKEPQLGGARQTVVVEVGSVLKGKLTVKTFELVLHQGGVRGFDPTLKEKDAAVFFLSGLKGGQAALSRPGAIALLPYGYFH